MGTVINVKIVFTQSSGLKEDHDLYLYDYCARWEAM
jgi:hypothetical protein